MGRIGGREGGGLCMEGVGGEARVIRLLGGVRLLGGRVEVVFGAFGSDSSFGAGRGGEKEGGVVVERVS